MKPPEIIVGLDIGTTKIACVVGRRDDYGKIEIMGVARKPSLGVKRGMVANIESTVESIRQAVEEASIKSNVLIKTVHVGIAGQHIKSLQHLHDHLRNNANTEITQDELDAITDNMYKLATSPGEEIIEVIPQEYTVDGEPGIKSPKGQLGNLIRASFHIITGQTISVKNIYTCVRKAGLEVSGLSLEPIASAEAVLSAEEKEAGVVLVDIGGGTTDIAIFQDDIIRHTAVIPFGGDVITEDIREGCAIIRRYAEEIKIRYGSALASENREEQIVTIPGLKGRPAKEISLRNLASIIQARMEEIIEHVYYEIKNSNLEKKLIAGIVLTGGGAQLKHIAQLTSYITGMDTRIGYPNEHLSSSSPDEIGSPMYATGVGLVMTGLEKLERSSRREQDLKGGKKGGKGGRGGSFFDKIKKMFESEDEAQK